MECVTQKLPRHPENSERPRNYNKTTTSFKLTFGILKERKMGKNYNNLKNSTIKDKSMKSVFKFIILTGYIYMYIRNRIKKNDTTNR